jgi:hypothetical protein
MAEIKLDMMELKLDRLIDEMRFLKAPAWDRDVSQTERTERTTARKQTHAVVRGRCQRDGKDSFVCSRGSGRGGPDQALSGSMTRVLTVPGPPGAVSRVAKEHRPTGRAGLIRIGEEDS